MEGLLSQIQTLDATDIASILRQVQSGSLTLEETASDSASTEASSASQAQSQSQAQQDESPTVHNFVDAITEDDASSGAGDPLANLTARHISLRRPGRNAPPVSLQSTDSDVVVPLSKTELQKQIFQARMLGAPTEIANRISQKAGLGSPPSVKPNVGLCRSVSRNASQQVDNERDANILDEQWGPSQEYGRDRTVKSPERNLSATESPSSYRNSDDRTKQTRYYDRQSDSRRSPDFDTRERSVDRQQESRQRSDRSRSQNRSRSPLDRSRNNDQRSVDKTKRRQSDQRRSPDRRSVSPGNKSMKNDQENSDRRRSPDRRPPGNRGSHDEMRSSDRSSDRSVNKISDRRRSPNRRSPDKRRSHDERRSVDKQGSKSGRRASQNRVHDSDHKDGNKVSDETHLENRNRREREKRNRSKASKRRATSQDDLDRKKRKSKRKSQDAANRSDTGNNTSVEEIVPIIEEPMPKIVLAQVDKEAAACSFESLSTFKIPKKGSTAKPTPAEDKKQTPSLQESHKRGATHENVGGVTPWHGVSTVPYAQGAGRCSSKTMKAVRGIVNNELPTCKAKEILDADWYDNIHRVKGLLHEIPTAQQFLNREEMQEVQKEYLASLKTWEIHNVSKSIEYMKAKKWVQKNKSQFVTTLTKCDDWFQNQKKLFSKLDMESNIQAINYKITAKTTMFCYLCQKDIPLPRKMLQYNEHINGKHHGDNIARARTKLGKMFLIKYLQSIVNKDKPSTADLSKETQGSLSKKRNFCEICMKKIRKVSLEEHYKTQKHKDAVKHGRVRPKCEVCDIVFNNVKDQRHHITRQYHKTNVERKMEYGELPADYKDPFLGESSQEEDNATEGAKSTAIESSEPSVVQMPTMSDDEEEEPMEVEDLSSEDGINDQQEESLLERYQNEEDQEDVPKEGQQTEDEQIRSEREKRIEEYAHKNYGEWLYFEDYQNLYPGMQPGIWKHISRQDWIDVIEEYGKKVEEQKEDPLENYREARDFVDMNFTPMTCEPGQMAVLDWLGLKQHMEGKKLRDGFCYICQKYNPSFKQEKYYNTHMDKSKKHLQFVAMARTTIGRMFLTKYLQSQPATFMEKPKFILRDTGSNLSSDDMKKDQQPKMEMNEESASGTSHYKTSEEREETEKIVEELFTHKNYGDLQYFRAFQHLYPGIQRESWELISRQDWIDVVDEYRVKVKDLKEDPWKNMGDANKYVNQNIRSKTCVLSQMTLLDRLGLKKHTEGRKLKDNMCFFCMTGKPFKSAEKYAAHAKNKRHFNFVAKARTTIGRMLLIKILQSQPPSHVEKPNVMLEETGSKLLEGPSGMQTSTKASEETMKVNNLSRDDRNDDQQPKMISTSQKKTEDKRRVLNEKEKRREELHYHKNYGEEKYFEDFQNLYPEIQRGMRKFISRRDWIEVFDLERAKSGKLTELASAALRRGREIVRKEMASNTFDHNDRVAELAWLGLEKSIEGRKLKADFCNVCICSIATHSSNKKNKHKSANPAHTWADHIKDQEHLNSLAKACTPTGKLLLVKYLQRLPFIDTDKDVDSVYTHNRYGTGLYFRFFMRMYPGIQTQIWKHISRQEWIEVVDKCRHVEEIASEKPQTYLTSLEMELNSETRDVSQMALLDSLGLKEHMEGKKLKECFCYICIQYFPRPLPKSYDEHLKSKKHRLAHARAKTVIGKMLLAKYLQSLPSTTVKETRIPGGYCLDCDDTYRGTKLFHFQSIQHKKAFRNKLISQGSDNVVDCIVCNQVFDREDQKLQHLGRVYHNVNLSCKLEHGLLPSDYEDCPKEEEHFREKENKLTYEELVLRGNRLMDTKIQGIFCKVCGLFFTNIDDKTTFEESRQEHMKDKWHQVKLTEYYRKLNEKENNNTRQTDAETSSSSKTKTDGERSSVDASLKNNTDLGNSSHGKTPSSGKRIASRSMSSSQGEISSNDEENTSRIKKSSHGKTSGSQKRKAASISSSQGETSSDDEKNTSSKSSHGKTSWSQKKKARSISSLQGETSIDDEENTRCIKKSSHGKTSGSQKGKGISISSLQCETSSDDEENTSRIKKSSHGKTSGSQKGKGISLSSLPGETSSDDEKNTSSMKNSSHSKTSGSQKRKDGSISSSQGEISSDDEKNTSSIKKSSHNKTSESPKRKARSISSSHGETSSDDEENTSRIKKSSHGKTSGSGVNSGHIKMPSHGDVVQYYNAGCISNVKLTRCSVWLLKLSVSTIRKYSPIDADMLTASRKGKSTQGKQPEKKKSELSHSVKAAQVKHSTELEKDKHSGTEDEGKRKASSIEDDVSLHDKSSLEKDTKKELVYGKKPKQPTVVESSDAKDSDTKMKMKDENKEDTKKELGHRSKSKHASAVDRSALGRTDAKDVDTKMKMKDKNKEDTKKELVQRSKTKHSGAVDSSNLGRTDAKDADTKMKITDESKEDTKKELAHRSKTKHASAVDSLHLGKTGANDADTKMKIKDKHKADTKKELAHRSKTKHAGVGNGSNLGRKDAKNADTKMKIKDDKTDKQKIHKDRNSPHESKPGSSNTTATHRRDLVPSNKTDTKQQTSQKSKPKTVEDNATSSAIGDHLGKPDTKRQSSQESKPKNVEDNAKSSAFSEELGKPETKRQSSEESKPKNVEGKATSSSVCKDVGTLDTKKQSSRGSKPKNVEENTTSSIVGEDLGESLATDDQCAKEVKGEAATQNVS